MRSISPQAQQHTIARDARDRRTRDGVHARGVVAGYLVALAGNDEQMPAAGHPFAEVADFFRDISPHAAADRGPELRDVAERHRSGWHSRAHELLRAVLDEVAFRVERRGAALARGGDGLPVAMIRHVARGKNTGNIRRRDAVLLQEIAVRIHREDSL